MNFERGLLRRIGLASTAAGALLYAALPMAAPARAGNDNMLSSVTNFFKAPFGGGTPTTDGDANEAIDYRPRPVLVVPPSYDLPPPQPRAAGIADWPKEPDGVALRKAKADSRRPAPPIDASAGDHTPSPDGVVATNASTQSANCSGGTGKSACVAVPWRNSNAFNLSQIPGLNLIPGLKKSGEPAIVRLNSNPTRKYLTDPPVDYMEAVQLPENGQASDKQPDKAQDKTHGGTQGLTRAPPAIDETPPGK